VQAIAGKVQGLRRLSLIEAGENILNRVAQIRPYSAAIIPFVQSFEAAMLETPYHQRTP
jgi:hypothetical protein